MEKKCLQASAGLHLTEEAGCGGLAQWCFCLMYQRDATPTVYIAA